MDSFGLLTLYRRRQRIRTTEEQAWVACTLDLDAVGNGTQQSSLQPAAILADLSRFIKQDGEYRNCGCH
jgi:hypothetical protein